MSAVVREVRAHLSCPERCNGCALCLYRCPTGNVLLIDRRPCFGDECLACGVCLEVCARQALGWKGVPSEG